ncbi:putative breast carcinoma amplified sequence [Operophtera brumata]|uniref:Putative breast carcinoma amplified sequence n=1 Tax=Operophtera brumata TaxID=104452 RepID=A0A0L7LHC5_OPEBR|nr:putative breast carcinoma amplified sequence [Operophtera brumata]
MCDATRDHPPPERPDISVASTDKSPTLEADSSSVKVSVVIAAERSRTPEPARDVVEIKEPKQVDDIPPIETPVESKRKSSESKLIVEDSKQASSKKLAQIEQKEFDELKSFKKSPKLSKKESKSKKETLVSLKREPSPSKKETSVPLKREPSPSSSNKESLVTSKEEPAPPKLESIVTSKRESSSTPSMIESPAPSKKETSPWPSKKESSLLDPQKDSLSSSRREFSPTRSRKDSLSSSKKEAPHLTSKKESLSSSNRESSPCRSRKEPTSHSKKELSPSPSRKESLPPTQKEPSPSHSFSEMFSFTRESSDCDSSPRHDMTDSSTLWKKDKFDWSRKQSSELKTAKKEITEAKASSVVFNEVVKTEEQAWDLLLSQPERQELSVSPQSMASDKSDETKPKSKKHRKLKKSQEDSQNKSEDDSFVEIHAIDEKVQLSCGELVSISMPYEEIESSSSYSSRTKKSRSPKNLIEKKETKLDDWSLDDHESTFKLKSTKKKSDASDIDIFPELDSKVISKERRWEKVSDAGEIKRSDITEVENIVVKESLQDKKYKLPSYYESRKSAERAMEAEVKDVYVIDSTNDEFPEIQITRGSKLRKKSTDTFKTETEDVEKPIKSWSSIAASKNVKKDEKFNETITENATRKKDTIEKRVIESYDVDEVPSKSVSLQEELMRLCKRTNIMVAQCDTPTELNFFDEHHLLLQDLTPLELDFNLDDFKLEVMRDSLLEGNETKVSSPICKIDIDNILSSIKESSSTFNLIDLKEVPAKKEKGFSVIESDKITSLEIKADDEVRTEDKDVEVMEKSSDDDNASPVLSTDSDKDDKKSTGASNLTLPSSKQSNKSKKSRKKKK